jgi:hypothetical protein
MAAKDIKKAQATLARNRLEAYRLAEIKGKEQTKGLMEEAANELRQMLSSVNAPDEGTFTGAQMRATLAQLEDVISNLTEDLGKEIVRGGRTAARESVLNTSEYLGRVDRAHKGLGEQGLAIKEASMLDYATKATESTIIRRLSSLPDDPDGLGVLARYGLSTIQDFEQVMQKGLLMKKSWSEMRDELVTKSPFLQGSPMSWAERILRTEIMGAYNRSGWETMRYADEELGDMVKILAATFDDRTGSDSIALHGQIRKVEQAFDWWGGKYMHPPNRPNDREVVVPHRIAWPLPEYLQIRSEAEVFARWRKEKRKGSPPARPKMTTVPLSKFGKEQKPKEKKQDGRERQQVISNVETSGASEVSFEE